MVEPRLISSVDLQTQRGNAASLLPRYRARLARALAGGGRVRIACVGTSVFTGQGGGSGGSGIVGAKVKAWPAQLAKLFRKAGFVVSEDSVWGDNFAGGTAGTLGVTEYDPKTVFAGASWSRSGSGPAGFMFLNLSGTDVLSFTPAVAGQNIEVYYVTDSGHGTFTIKDGVTTLATPSADTPSSGFTKQTLSRTLSANAINIARTGTGGRLYIGGIDQWANDTEISIYNMGASASTTATWIQNGKPWEPLLSPAYIAPDVIFLGLDINDIRTGVPTATYKANMQTCITAWKTAGIDIVIVRQHPDNAPVNTSLIEPYRIAQLELAATNGLPLIDMTERFGSFAVANAQGEYFDTVHLTSVGYADYAMGAFDIVGPR